MSVPSISVHELKQQCDSCEPIHLIDVRTPEEFQQVRVPNAKNIPLDKFNSSTVSAAGCCKTTPIYVICKSGGRSLMACRTLLNEGFESVFNVRGGTMAWVSAGHEVC